MTSIEYGRHARRILEWDEVEAETETPTLVDLTHGSVFLVDDQAIPQKESLLGSMKKLLTLKVI